MSRFNRIARRVTNAVGSSWAVILAFVFIIVWIIGGLVGGFSDQYQLFMNTSTTIVTFLLVFLIQSTMNRDSKALHLKLDELITSVDAARNEYKGIEDDDSDSKLQALKQKEQDG